MRLIRCERASLLPIPSRLSSTVGVCQVPTDTDSIQALIDLADKAINSIDPKKELLSWHATEIKRIGANMSNVDVFLEYRNTYQEKERIINEICDSLRAKLRTARDEFVAQTKALRVALLESATGTRQRGRRIT